MKLQTTMVQNMGAKRLPDGGPEDGHLRGIVAVPGGKALGEGEVEPEQAHGEKQLAEILKVNRLQVVLKVEELAAAGPSPG